MREKLLLDGELYTKTDAKRRCQALLWEGPLSTPLEGHDAQFVTDLFRRHPDAERKIGAGIAFFTVEPTKFGARGFILHRIDGTTTDWSYPKALTPPSHEQYAREAMRHAVEHQIFAYRDRAFANVDQIQCPISGEWVGKLACHIDHAWPITFLHLADKWAVRAGGYEAVQHGSGDNQFGRRMTDVEQRDSWLAYHLERAQLRVVSPNANVGVLRRMSNAS